MKKILLISLLLTSCLRSGNWVEQLRNRNYSIVKIGRYPHTTKTIRHPTDLKRGIEWNEFIAQLRTTIEEDPELLETVTKYFFPEERSELIFKYKFTSVDKKRSKLILRYFAPILAPRILAGYQYQFVVDLKNSKLDQILLSEVPLEK